MGNYLKLKQLIEYLDVSTNAFEQAIKARQSTVSAGIRHGRALKEEMADKVIKTYPNVSKSWLLGTSEQMLIDPTKPATFTPEVVPLIPGERVTTKNGNEFIELGNDQYIMITPLIHQYAYAGYQAGFKDDEYIAELPKHPVIVDGIHFGTYRTFEVRGDSMDDGTKDAICSGDKVTGRLVAPEYWRTKLHLRKYSEWIIHTTNNGILVKEIITHDVDRGVILLHSRNPDKDTYPDTEVNLADCKEIYSIISVLKSRK